LCPLSYKPPNVICPCPLNIPSEPCSLLGEGFIISLFSWSFDISHIYLHTFPFPFFSFPSSTFCSIHSYFIFRHPHLRGRKKEKIPAENCLISSALTCEQSAKNVRTRVIMQATSYPLLSTPLFLFFFFSSPPPPPTAPKVTGAEGWTRWVGSSFRSREKGGELQAAGRPARGFSGWLRSAKLFLDVQGGLG